MSSEVDTYEIENLKCGTKYKISMSAFNKLGIGQKSPELEISTDGDGKSTSKDFHMK